MIVARIRPVARASAVLVVAAILAAGCVAPPGDGPTTPKPGAVAGSIHEAEGQEIAVELWAADLVDATRTTIRADDNGDYRFDGLPPGDYNVAVASDEAIAQTLVEVKEGSQTSLDWTFAPEPLGCVSGCTEPATFRPADPVFTAL